MWLAPGKAQLFFPLYLLIVLRHRRSLSQDPYRFRIGSYRLVPGLPDLLLAVADRLHFGSRLNMHNPDTECRARSPPRI